MTNKTIEEIAKATVMQMWKNWNECIVKNKVTSEDMDNVFANAIMQALREQAAQTTLPMGRCAHGVFDAYDCFQCTPRTTSDNTSQTPNSVAEREVSEAEMEEGYRLWTKQNVTSFRGYKPVWLAGYRAALAAKARG